MARSNPKTKISPNKQHVLLWLGLVIVALGLVFVTVFVFTGGERRQSGAASLTFTEDFTTTNFKDPGTTANWDTTGENTPGEGRLFHGQWTALDGVTLGAEPIPKTGADFIGTADNVYGTFAVNPAGEPVIAFSFFDSATVNTPPYLPTSHLRFTRYDLVDKRWEDMLGNPGYMNAAPGLLSPAYAYTMGQISTRQLPFDSFGNPIIAFMYQPTVSTAIQTYVSRWCPSPPTQVGATVSNTWGNAACTAATPENISNKPFHATFGQIAIDTTDQIHVIFGDGTSGGFSTGLYYTKFNGTSWVTSTGAPGSENFITATSGAVSMAITPAGKAYAVYSGPSPTFETRGVASSPLGFTNFTGTPGFTVFPVNASFGGFGGMQSMFDPADDAVHFLYAAVSGAVTHTFWDADPLSPTYLSFQTQGGAPGAEVIPFSASFGSFARDLLVDPINPLRPVAVWGREFRQWDIGAQAWLPHHDQTSPEMIPAGGLESLDEATVFAADGTLYHITAPYCFGGGSCTHVPKMFISRFTPQRVFEQKNMLQSLSVDATDRPIVSATLTVDGESRGNAGTLPLNAQGRNAVTDIDCFMSNDNGINYFAVTVGNEFTFPTNGSRLRWRCELTSGTLVDWQALRSLFIQYNVAEETAQLQLNKNLDVNGDGIFDDNGLPIRPGQILTYAIDVFNSGNAGATNVVVTDPIPTGATYVPDSTKVDGAPVADINGSTPLASGLSIGDLPAGNFFQTDWSGGPGQLAFSDHTKFGQEDGMQFREPEILRMPTDNLFVDESFAFPDQAANANSTTNTARSALDGALVLNDGRLFLVWANSAGEIVGRIFNNEGGVLTGEILISNPAPAIKNEAPALTQLPNGDIVVVWNTELFGSEAASTTQNIVMRRLDSDGNILSPTEIVLVSEPALFSPNFSYIHLDEPFTSFVGSAKSPIVHDASGNIYVGFVRADAATGCAKAKVAKFDQDGIPQWLGIPPEIQVDTGSCQVQQGPSLAINSLGQIAAFFLEGLSPSKLVSTIVDGSGAIIAPATTVLSTSFGLSAGSAAALPGSSTDFVITSRYPLNSSCGGTICLQRISNTNTVITNVPLAIDTFFSSGSPDVAVDEPNQRIGVGWIDLSAGEYRTRLFDNGLNALTGEVVAHTISSFAMRAPHAAMSPHTNQFFATWLQGSFFGGNLELKALGYEPALHELFSSIYDAGQATIMNTVGGHAVVPSGTSLDFALRAGDTPIPDASWTSFVTTPYTFNGTLIQGTVPDTLGSHRFFQNKIIMGHTNVTATPTLDDIFFSQGAVVRITFQVQVTATVGNVISDTASVTASNAVGVTSSNTTRNSVGPVSSTVIGGTTRIETAILLSQYLFPNPGSAPCMVLVRDDDPVDGLSGAPLTAQCGGAILLNPTSHLDSRVLTELRRVLVPGGKIYILGRERALAEQVRIDLTANGLTNQERVGGSERRDTSQLIGRELQSLESQTITEAYIANAYTMADALSSSSPASRKLPGGTRAPELLVKSNELTAEVRDFLVQHPGITRLYIIGGITAIDSNVEAQLRALPQHPTIERIAGPERFTTTTRVAERFFNPPVIIYAMSGYGFPVRTATGITSSGVPVDALLAGPAAAADNAPILFIKTDEVPTPIRTYLEINDPTIGQIIFIGGDDAIHPDVRQEMLDLLQ